MGPHILLVDDDEPLRRMFREVLERAGMQVTTATNGREAIALLDTITPDVLVSDVFMPETPGDQLIEAIRADARHCDMKIIAITAYPSAQRKLAKNGADAVVLKPISIPQILAEIENLTGTNIGA